VADDAGGGLNVPSTDNWNEWTFEQALKALTGEGADLHTPAKASWFTFDPNPSQSDNITYHAYDKYWYGANIDQQAVTTWKAAIDTIDEMMADVALGKRGNMNHQSVLDLAQAIRTFADFNHGAANVMTSWANRLDSDDSSFRGKAAFLIQWRLKAGGDGLTDTYEQVTTRHGKNIADVVNDAAVELGNFNKTMGNAWNSALASDMRNWLDNAIRDAINAIAGYIDDSGLDQHHGPYKLDSLDAESGKAFVQKMLSAYPKGDLTTAAGWQSISKSITTILTNNLNAYLDKSARSAITALAPKYTLATSSLIEITAPLTETPPQADPDADGNGDGDVPPPPEGDGSGEVPPPPEGGGSGEVPPPPEGGGSGEVPPPDGGIGDSGIGDGGIGNSGIGDGGIGDGGLGDGGLGGPPGAGGDIPADGGVGPFVPGLVPPGGGTGIGDDRANGGTGIGPGGDGAFDEKGAGNGLLTPPDGGADGPNSLLPSGTGESRTAIPPGSGLNEIGHDGFGLDPGKGGNGVGGGSGVGLGNGGGGVGGGFGSGTGSGGLNGLNGLPTQLSGGSPGMNGAPGSSEGGGGVPFFPPMMGGAGQSGAGEKPQERERQTWLSEDEEIWGTRVAVGSGVIGRLDDEEFELEEVPLAGPSRRIRRPETPRRPRPAEEAAREATTAGEEASGSA
jgi:hypothetical protein